MFNKWMFYYDDKDALFRNINEYYFRVPVIDGSQIDVKNPNKSCYVKKNNIFDIDKNTYSYECISSPNTIFDIFIEALATSNHNIKYILFQSAISCGHSRDEIALEFKLNNCEIINKYVYFNTSMTGTPSKNLYEECNLESVLENIKWYKPYFCNGENYGRTCSLYIV